MKKIVIVCLLLAGVMSCQSDDKDGVKVDTTTPVELTFETLKQGDGINEPIPARCYVLHTKEQWIDFKETAKMFGSTAVEFSDYEAIVIFDEAKETSGYTIEIKSITKVNSQLIIKVQKESPAPDTEVAIRVSQPYHGIVLRKTGLPVIVEEIASE